jgi:hypothetical protein
MKRVFFSVLGSLALASTMVVAQQAPTPGQPIPNPAPRPTYPAPVNPEPKTPNPVQPPSVTSSHDVAEDTTVTGCLTQGSGPSVFVLSDARTATELATEAGTTYLLSPASADVKFAEELNHEVRVTGKTDKSGSPSVPNQQMDEKDMAKLTATKVTSIAERCMAAVSTGVPGPATKY